MHGTVRWASLVESNMVSRGARPFKSFGRDKVTLRRHGMSLQDDIALQARMVPEAVNLRILAADSCEAHAYVHAMHSPVLVIGMTVHAFGRI